MAIDWDRAVDVVSGELQNQITVMDEETVNVCAGKVILYVHGTGGGGGGDAVWGDITGTLSNQTDLQNALNSKANTASLGDMAYIDDAPSDGKEYARKNGSWSEVTGGGSGSAVWGEIDGTLSDQTDLNDALAAKADLDLLADTFDPETAYSDNDFVTQNSGLYKITERKPSFRKVTAVNWGDGTANAGDAVYYNNNLCTFITQPGLNGTLRWAFDYIEDAWEFVQQYVREVPYTALTAEGSANEGDFVTYGGNPYYFTSDATWSCQSVSDAFSELKNTQQVLASAYGIELSYSGILNDVASSINLLIYQNKWYVADLKGYTYVWHYLVPSPATDFLNSYTEEVTDPVPAYDPTATYQSGDLVEIDNEVYQYFYNPGYDFVPFTVEEMADFKIAEYDAPEDNKTYGRKNGAWTEITGGGGGSAAWGDITGTLSNQTDLQSALNAKADTADLGDLAALDNIDYTSNYLTNKPTLGALASKNTADYATDITNKPTLGDLSALNAIDYTSNYLTNKPTLGSLAAKNTVDYATEVTNKPTLGTMAAESASDYYDKSDVDDALDAKQDELTFDSTPTASSANPVTSGGVYTAIHGRALHISMASTSSLGTISNAAITTTMRVVNIVWGTPSNVTSDVTWNTDTAGQLVLSGTLAGATTAEIDLIDFG